MSVIERLNGALEGRYRVERELGQGGMATVYLADDVRHERRVALKVLKPELAAVVGAERFLAEIKTTANLQHPHILPLFDSGEADGFLYYVMPYVEGETLRDRLDREKQLPVDEAVGIATAIAGALEAAHELGVVHRDIKPANVLLSRDQPLVADFGIAIAVSAGGGRLTETGMSLGTPYYMSPEQATGDQRVGPASDVYALGCVLYEMLVGDPPYMGSTAQAVLGKILQGEAPSATAARPTIPPNVDAAVRKALERLPADRFTRARDFAGALADRGFRHGAADTGGAAATGGPWKRVSAGLAVLLAVVSVVAAWGWLGSGPPGAPQGPSLRTTLDLGSERPTANGDAVIISPDGSRLAFGTALGGAGPRVLMLRSAEDLTFRPIPGTDGVEPYGYAFSPDGEWIAYVVGNAIMKVSLLGGLPSVVVSLDETPFDLNWGSKGWIVFHMEGDAGTGILELYRVPESGGTPERLVGAPWSAERPKLLPDGSGVVFEDAASGRIALYDFEADSVRALGLRGVDPTYVMSGHLVYGDGSGGLWAAAFDLGRRALTGEGKPLLQGLGNGRLPRFAVSRTGTLVYETGGRAPLRHNELALLDLEGGEEVLPLEPRRMLQLRWAPDGRRISYVGYEPGETGGSRDSAQVYVYDAVVRGRPRQLTTTGNHRQAVWSPDGAYVAFNTLRGGDNGGLHVRSVDGDERERAVASLPGRPTPLDWPRDRVLLFSVDVGGTPDIWMVDPLAEEPVARPYLESESGLGDARMSPDGSLVAYASNESGQWEVYVRSFPDPGPALRVSEGGALRPAWAPDGGTLYYAAGNPWSSPGSLVAARLVRGPTLAVASRDTLRNLPAMAVSWDLHPDGDRIVTILPEDPGGESAEPEPKRMIVIANWFDELRRRMGEGGGGSD